MLSTLIGPLLVFLAHASGFAWIADRTPARQRALRPLAPLVAITAIAGAVATGFVLSSALHRDVRGQVTARLDVPIKAGRATLLRVRESDGSTIDVSVPRALWTRCGLGDSYARRAWSPTLRCGAVTAREPIAHVGYGLAAWGALLGVLLAASGVRLRHTASGRARPA